MILNNLSPRVCDPIFLQSQLRIPDVKNLSFAGRLTDIDHILYDGWFLNCILTISSSHYWYYSLSLGLASLLVMLGALSISVQKCYQQQSWFLSSRASLFRDTYYLASSPQLLVIYSIWEGRGGRGEWGLFPKSLKGDSAVVDHLKLLFFITGFGVILSF